MVGSARRPELDVPLIDHAIDVVRNPVRRLASPGARAMYRDAARDHLSVLWTTSLLINSWTIERLFTFLTPCSNRRTTLALRMHLLL
jgi:hypothetical protein